MASWREFFRRAIAAARAMARPALRAVVVPENPALDRLPADQLVIVGGPGYQKWAYLRCPCGCGTPIMLSLSKTRRPSWRVRIDSRNRPTVRPSVWQTAGCYSHFFIRRGQIVWVGKGVAPPPDWIT